MKSRIGFIVLLALAFTLPVATLLVTAQTGKVSRPEGPCDIYAAAGAPCVAAHSSTRALYAAYNGPLYQVLRQSDGKTLDIGVVKPSSSPVPDAGGYADAAAQDKFCANTVCWITTIYDQSGKGNHLVQAPRGGFSGPSMGGFNNLPIADMAPVTLMGHKVYGVFIEPGMGLRQNDAHGTAVDDQAEGQYWVINGLHYNSGCCFDYGNAETDSRDDGDGTMETTYYGNATAWYRGTGPGPWIMTDQENNLVGCVNPSPNDKACLDVPTITWRFVTATADGEPHHWRSMGGDARTGNLHVMYDGPRIKNDNNTYDPMRKQGAILVGNGGDNSNGSQGTFYEGAMTAPNTFPSQETQQKIQANVVTAKYDVQMVSIAPSSAIANPPGLQTFAPGSSQYTTVTFTNTTGAPAADVTLSITTPKGWKSKVDDGSGTTKTFASVPPGATVSANFVVTSGSGAFNGDLLGSASWTNQRTGSKLSEIAIEKVRSLSPIKINEFAISSGSPANSTNTFIELHNASDKTVDISNWTLTQHPTQQPIFSRITIPSGTKVGPRGFYLLGLSNSGLVAPAKKGDTTIYVRNTTDMKAGDTIEIDTGSGKEIRTIATVTAPAPAAPATGQGGGMGGGGPRGGGAGVTTVWQPVPDGPVITIPVGSTNIPVTSVNGFEVGQKMAIGYGATYPAAAQSIEKYEVVTITAVGKPGTQAWTAVDTKPGDTNIKVSAVANISVGDKIRFGYDTVGHGVEWATVKKVGTQSAFAPNYPERSTNKDGGTGLDLEAPLKFHHSANTPFSARGTGITFTPATEFAHSSNEPVLPLTTSITLDQPLAKNHEVDAVVYSASVTAVGYQGTRKPDQWFGGPALGNAGSMVLRDAGGRISDSMNYGGMVDPWAGEGYQATSGANASGCYVPAPAGGGGRGGGGAATVAQPNRSVGRYPDGFDTDSNCNDFRVQTTTTLAAAAAVGADNVKVAGVSDFVVGQEITLNGGANAEKVIVAMVGTPGSTTSREALAVGATVIPVVGVNGFTVGQHIVVDSGATLEPAVIASIVGGAGGGRGGMGGAAGAAPSTASITVTAPLRRAHATGVQVAGTGISIVGTLKKAHDSGAPVAGSVPTPGAPNQISRRP